MTGLATEEFTAFIGLDWADAKHAICLQAAGSDKREVQVLEHRSEVIEAWATALLQRFAGGPIAIALELNKGPIVEALRKYDGFVLFHINPMMLAKYREAFTSAASQPCDPRMPGGRPSALPHGDWPCRQGLAVPMRLSLPWNGCHTTQAAVSRGPVTARRRRRRAPRPA